MTFGDGEGRSDALAGSLANGWSVTPPADVRGSGDGATQALTGINAIVCAAGAGPLPTKAVATVEAARQNGMTLSLTGSAAVDGVGSIERDVQVRRAELWPVAYAAASLARAVIDMGIPCLVILETLLGDSIGSVLRQVVRRPWTCLAVP